MPPPEPAQDDMGKFVEDLFKEIQNSKEAGADPEGADAKPSALRRRAESLDDLPASVRDK